MAGFARLARRVSLQRRVDTVEMGAVVPCK